MSSPQLAPHEKICAGLLIGALVFFFSLAYIRTPLETAADRWSPHHLKSTTIEVTIQGAVANPGTYMIDRGSTVEALLELAQPLPEADLSKVKTTMKLYQHKKVIIPCKKQRKVRQKAQGTTGA